jgi:hypothetical protein
MNRRDKLFTTSRIRTSTSSISLAIHSTAHSCPSPKSETARTLLLFVLDTHLVEDLARVRLGVLGRAGLVQDALVVSGDAAAVRSASGGSALRARSFDQVSRMAESKQE